MRLHKLILQTSSVLVLGMSQQALAQAVQETPGDEPTGISEIVVTAQRREENLQKVAVAVSAVAPDQLISAGISDVSNISKLVPALVAQPNGGSSTNFYLRGVGSYATNAFAENAIAFNFAGVYVARPTSPLGTFFDLERLEVVKGPQGTLYGRNATGGAINVLPKLPELGKYGGSAMIEAGNYSSVKAQAAVNIPLGERAALRIAGQVADRDGYMSDGYDDDNGQALRASLLFEPTETLKISLMGDYYHQGGKGVGSVLVRGPLTQNAPAASARIGGSDPISHAAVAANFPTLTTAANTGIAAMPRDDGFVDSHFYGVTGTIEADLGFATLTVIPAYRRSEPDFLSYALGFLSRVQEIDNQYSLEVRLASASDQRLRYVLGGFLFKEDQAAQNTFTQGRITSTTFNPNLETKSKAIFGELTFDINDQLRLVGGARYTKEDKSLVTPLRQVTLANPNPPFRTVTGDLTFDKVTWKGGVEFDLAPRSLLYANVATGFKAGGFFVAIRNNTFAPEELTAFTIGSKNRFFDNKLQLNIEAFYWKYRDQQIGFVGPVETSIGVFGAGGKTVNAGNARMFGVEAELLFQPTPQDRFSANLQYLNSKYESFVYTQISANGAPPRSGCPVTRDTSIAVAAPAALYAVNCAGRPAVNAPRWSFSGGYEHDFVLADLLVTPGGRTRIESSRFLGIEYLPESRQGGYMSSDLYLTVGDADKRWSITGFVNNVENETIFASSVLRPVVPIVYNALRPPRTYGLRASFNY
ncbi:TonB-dependent receptor [Novosphingobium sp. AAP83]|uniref:TonB-dependent receptor n=1 Tax=Novosphingobium sp. AAP83 TaxID=1523425 RepID=UPI0006B88CAD|nr:TonB-dependent receptor [Novosphingobium sp. AAP83]